VRRRRPLAASSLDTRRLDRRSANRSSLQGGSVAIDGGVDRFEVPGDLVALTPRNVFEAVTDQVHVSTPGFDGSTERAVFQRIGASA
jgi:hypothetical protein